MSSPQSDDEILNCDPEGCDPSSNLSEKTTETGVPRGPEVRDASASDATVAEVDTENRIELTRIATELYNVDLGDPVLDPNSPDFDVYRWAKTVVRVADEAGVKFRRASFAFKDLRVSGSRVTARFQTNAASSLVAPLRLQEHVYSESRSEKAILRGLDGVTKSVEILLVLGRSGSGCSTFLKTVSGDLHGLKVDKDSELHYNGIPQEEMICQYKGEIIYNSEIDRHFPHLTVRETLEFAAAVRTPQNRLLDVSRKQHGKRTTAIAMAICGLAHAQNTKVGNDFVRGVSGGERKRVSIAEMMLAASSIGCWDNSTHGLDSATALEFVRSLRMFADIIGTTHAVALYQASRALYEVFDKVIVLYEGREVYFGRTEDAKSYFEEMGWCCQPRQTTADFLTSVTNHEERRPRHGFENLVPRTSKEFQHYWKTSQDYKTLLAEIRNYERELSNHTAADAFKASRRAAQSRHLRATSPYLVSIPLQIKACTTRAYQLLWNDKASTLAVVLGQVIMALIIGSIFYGTSDNTDSFFAKGSTLFFATLLNALVAVTEINSLYLQRQVVEKQASYAFCHPFAEALAGVISDAPVKLVIATCFNLILYFMAGLRSEPAQFFAFFLFTSLVRFTMSAMFRTVAACARTTSQALAIAGVLILMIVVYTGYAIPRANMHPWFKWLTWISPLAYAFEALMVNEFHGRDFPCASFVPAYSNLAGDTFICPIAGAAAGQKTVSGDAYVEASFQYSYSHIWRNLGALIAFWMMFLAIYLFVTEFKPSALSTTEVLIFLRGRRTTLVQEARKFTGGADDRPSSPRNNRRPRVNERIALQDSIFTWRDVVYDIRFKGRPRRLLDHVSGWVKPGTLTALMGVSGAGKTTLLDVLAQRTSVGMVSGDMLVDGKPLESSFQRRTHYVQQQDAHLETSTVREALRFSAMLRQPKSVSKGEKYDHVEDVIEVLDMTDSSEAVVGVPGEGLNGLQRKLLSIGVELAAKPTLLIFLDEPTSGLDSQSAQAITAVLRKLANCGQAILATIHQPSSVLFLEFDRPLFLAKGGRTIYFGDIGPNAVIVLDYFKRHGARPCDQSENPAEYMLGIVTAGNSCGSEQDWPELWIESDELAFVKAEQERIHREVSYASRKPGGGNHHDRFAAPFFTQILHNTIRVSRQYWRTPSYVWGKLLLGGASALFIGFSFFKTSHSLQGLQNAMFSIFLLTSVLSSLVQQASRSNMLSLRMAECRQIIPRFVQQRSLFEIREGPSKVYSWVAFLLANIMVEVLYQLFLGILVYACYYYPVFGTQSSESQVLIMLFCIQMFLFAGTFTHMIIVVLPDAQTAGTIATLLFSMTMVFNGVFQPPQALPAFWVSMYRASPLTYIIGGIAAAGLHGYPVECSESEIRVFNPPSGFTCGDYLGAYLETAPGQLLNPTASSQCRYCPLSNSDQFLSLSAISWSTRWRNFGIGWANIIFNICMTMTLYYVFRVKKWTESKPARRSSKVEAWLQLMVPRAKSVLAMWWGEAAGRA